MSRGGTGAGGSSPSTSATHARASPSRSRCTVVSARTVERGIRIVVEAGDAHVARHLEAGFAQARDEPERHLVVRGEDGRRPVGLAARPARSAAASAAAVAAVQSPSQRGGGRAAAPRALAPHPARARRPRANRRARRAARCAGGRGRRDARRRAPRPPPARRRRRAARRAEPRAGVRRASRASSRAGRARRSRRPPARGAARRRRGRMPRPRHPRTPSRPSGRPREPPPRAPRSRRTARRASHPRRGRRASGSCGCPAPAPRCSPGTPSASMASSTRRRVSGRMLGWSLITRETVCDETPARSATSRTPTRPVRAPASLMRSTVAAGIGDRGARGVRRWRACGRPSGTRDEGHRRRTRDRRAARPAAHGDLGRSGRRARVGAGPRRRRRRRATSPRTARPGRCTPAPRPSSPASGHCCCRHCIRGRWPECTTGRAIARTRSGGCRAPCAGSSA